MANTYTLISSNVLTGSAASVTFSSIPSTYTDLVLRVSARTIASSINTTMYLKVNGDSSAIYSYTSLFGDGTGTGSSQNNLVTQSEATKASGDTATANTFSNNEIYIPSYTASQNRPISIFGVNEQNDNTGNAYIMNYASLYRSTTAITSLTLTPNATSFKTGSSFYLYGISKS